MDKYINIIDFKHIKKILYFSSRNFTSIFERNLPLNLKNIFLQKSLFNLNHTTFFTAQIYYRMDRIDVLIPQNHKIKPYRM